MQVITSFLQDKLMPIAGAIAGQRHFDAIRYGFVTFTPFLIVGSLFLIIANLPIPGFANLMGSLFGPRWDVALSFPVDATFGIMSLFIVGIVAYRLASSYKVDALPAAVLATVCFLIVTPFGLEFDGKPVGGALPIEWLGSKGLFVALIISILSTEIYRVVIARGIVIKMPAGVPPMVARSFASLIPAAIAMVVALLVRWLFMLTSYGDLHRFIYELVAIPLQYVGSTLFGAIITVIAITLLWAVGLNGGSVVNGMMRPIWYPLQGENLVAYKQGLAMPYIITEQFFDMIWMGGAGATLVVVLLLVWRARSQQYRELGKLSLGSGIFNINEPILFGLPVVLNPFMLVPFLVAPIFMCVINYLAMDWGIVAKPTGAVLPWTTPPLLQGWLVTGSISGALLQLFDMAVGLLIYWPFINIMDKQRFQEEQETK